MKKTRRSYGFPKAAVNYKKRNDTTFTVKPRRFKGIAGVRPTSFSEVAEETVENLDLGITITEPATAGETDFPVDNLSTEKTADNDGLNILNESFEPVETTATVEVIEINEVETEAEFVPTMDNTKKEILAFADSMGITVKGNWSKKKILDAIQN